MTLASVGFLILFFAVVNLLPKTGGTYYEFDKYNKTIDSPISATVKRIVEGKNYFGAQFGKDSNNYFGFTYHMERTPKLWLKEYPESFIVMGDSVFKKENNDTFFVLRNGKSWKYILPRDTVQEK
ncbi:hypothetical protein [Foetidibacter luteolus]|uniref:hypothetical protein n=1 Tax=Foetidibacter luteolus TaxID=2608880 RepID=UPI00129A1CB3|nr:hypothetical protein [Foetidibacter luteolus]